MGELKQYGNKKASQAKPRNFISKLLIGLTVAGVVVGIGYGAMLISSISSITNEISKSDPPPQATSHTIPADSQTQPDQVTPPAPTTQPTVAPKPKPQVAAKPAEQEVEAENESDADNAQDGEYQLSEEDQKRVKELQDMKTALPGNLALPTQMNETEKADIQAFTEEQEALRQLVENDTASPEERQRYFDMEAKVIQDGIDLINYCTNKLANSSAADGGSNALCSQITQDSDTRIKELNKLMDDMRKKLL